MEAGHTSGAIHALESGGGESNQDPTLEEYKEVIVRPLWGARNKTRKSQDYAVLIHAKPLTQDGEWEPLIENWNPSDSAQTVFELELWDFQVVPVNGGNTKRACIACGTFGGSVTVTLTRAE